MIGLTSTRYKGKSDPLAQAPSVELNDYNDASTLALQPSIVTGIGQGAISLAGTAAQIYGNINPADAQDAFSFADKMFETNRRIEELAPEAYSGVANIGRGVAKGIAQAAPVLAGPAAIPQAIGAATLAASTFAEKREELLTQGVDVDASNWTAALSASVAAVGIAAPAAIGLKTLIPTSITGGPILKSAASDLAARITTGAGINAAFGVADREGAQKILRDRGYNEVADQYEDLGGEAVAVDLLLGAVFGGASAGRAQIRDALAESDAFRRNLASIAIPKTVRGIKINQEIFETAGKQLFSGKKVDVTKVADEAALKENLDFNEVDAPLRLNPDEIKNPVSEITNIYDTLDEPGRKTIDELFDTEEMHDPDVEVIRELLAKQGDEAVYVDTVELPDGTTEARTTSLKEILAKSRKEIEDAEAEIGILQNLTDCYVANGDL